MRPVVITVAPTGGMLTTDRHPHVPTQPAEIADDVVRCAEAGASVAALHVRTPDQLSSCDPALYREANALIRERSDIVLNNSSGGGVSGPMRAPLGEGMWEISWPQRLEAVGGGADTVTLDAVTAWATVDGDEVLMNTSLSRARELGARILASGAKPEWEVFNPSQLTTEIPALLEQLRAPAPHLVNLCFDLGAVFTNASAWSPRLLDYMVGVLPAHAVFSVTVAGSPPWEALAHALVLGGHLRVGLEDHPWAADGSPTTNVALVEQAVRLVTAMGMRPASPSEAREILGLEERTAS